MNSSNPALNDKVFQKEIQASRQGGSFTPAWGSPADELPPGVFGDQRSTPRQPASTLPPVHPGQRTPPPSGPISTDDDDVMRVGGVTSATGLLLALLMVAGWFGWQSVTLEPVIVNQVETQRVASISPWLFAGAIGGFILAIVTVFKPKIARFTAPIYAVAQGLFIGGISHIFEAQYPGIVVQAVGLTIAVFAIMLVLFATGTIKVTNKLRTGIIAATGAVVVVYLISIVLSLFGTRVPMIHDAGPVGIGFSLLVVGIASFNLLLDFDFVQRGVAMRAPRYMEWFAAFGLMITLVWLYLELLKLLAKLRER